MRQSAGRACRVSRCRCEQPWLASTAVSVTPAGSDEGHRAEVNEKKQPMEDSFSGERVDAQVHNHPLEADVATVSQHMLATCNLVHRSKMAWREKTASWMRVTSRKKRSRDDDHEEDEAESALGLKCAHDLFAHLLPASASAAAPDFDWSGSVDCCITARSENNAGLDTTFESSGGTKKKRVEREGDETSWETPTCQHPAAWFATCQISNHYTPNNNI